MSLSLTIANEFLGSAFLQHLTKHTCKLNCQWQLLDGQQTCEQHAVTAQCTNGTPRASLQLAKKQHLVGMHKMLKCQGVAIPVGGQ